MEIFLSLIFLSESQKTTDGDGNIHTPHPTSNQVTASLGKGNLGQYRYKLVDQ
jgi:hypothetical protein